MANVTSADVREVVSSAMPDSYIDAIISLIYSKIGACLSSNYSEEVANLIVINLVAYFLEMADRTSEITSQKAPNGAQTNFRGVTKDGLSSSPFGRLVMSFDYAMCYLGLVTQPFGMAVIGSR